MRVAGALLCCALALAWTFAPVTGACAATSAAEAEQAVYDKSEVVYASLAADGSVIETYTVNRFDVEQAGTIVDYGSYDSVKALSSDVELALEAGAVTFDAEEGSFYYQGNAAATQLPWDIELTYALDGTACEAGELAGESGDVEIGLTSTASDEVAATFAESFVLQVTFTFASACASNIVANGASVAEAGSDTSVSFTVLPEQDADIALSMHVEDFEMDGVQIAAVPYSSVIDMPDTDDYVEQFEELASAISALAAGLAQTSDGMGQTSDGLAEAADGSEQFSSYLTQLSSSFAELTDASGDIDGALSELAEALGSADFSQLSELSELASSLRQLADALEALGSASAGITQVEGLLASSWASVGTALAAVEEAAPDDDAIAALEEALETAQDDESAATVRALIAEHEAVGELRAVYDAQDASVQAALGALEQLDFSTALAGYAAMLDAVADGLDEGLSSLSGLTQLADGVSTLASQYGSFDDGLAAFGSALAQMAESSGELSNGSAQLDEAVATLASAMQTLSENMALLDAETSVMPETAAEQIEELMADYEFAAFDGSSFASSANDDVVNVQFVLTTEAIEIPEDEQEAEEEEELGFIGRLLALFS